VQGDVPAHGAPPDPPRRRAATATTPPPQVIDPDRRHRAFVTSPGFSVAGAGGGPLAGTAVAVKDVFDVAGVPTGAGNPDWRATHPVPRRHAAAVQRLLDAGATITGKTVTDELAFSLSGTNVHHGMPDNPAAPGRVPGGSSAGSASAVAAGLADIGLGTDTAGSVRVPASYCGLFGFRPSWGRVPLEGCVPLAPGYDTVGWLTRSAALAAAVGAVLLAGEPPDRPGPAPSRLLIATDAFELLDAGVAERLQPAVAQVAALFAEVAEDRLAPAPDGGNGLVAWSTGFGTDQARQVWRTHGPWITAHAPRFGPGVAARFGWAATVTDADVAATEPVRRAARRQLAAVLSDHVVCLPAACGPPPPPDGDARDKDSLRWRTLALTCAAGLAGAPAISLPAARTADGPVNLLLMAAPGGDAALLELALRYGGAPRPA
jgi:amidase